MDVCVYSRPLLQCEAYQEFTSYTYNISIPALYRKRKEMQKLSPKMQKKPNEL